MPLHPEMQAWLDGLRAKNYPRLIELPLAEARQLYNNAFDTRSLGDSPANRQIIDINADVRVALYRSPTTPHRNAPALVFYHGGGFVFGSLDTHDEWCRFLANEAECVVISVDYRLAPDNPFPAAVEDAWLALNWVGEKYASLDIDPSRIVVGGDSAGGNLATVMTLMARELPTPHTPQILCQILLYMTADMTDMNSPTYETFAEGYFLEKADMLWFREQYVGEHDPSDWRISPLKAATLRALPPACVFTAEYDILRHQGEAYAKALMFAGNKVMLRRFEGLLHGFATMPQFDCTHEARDVIAQELVRRFKSAGAKA
jgi:acetyl esterase